MKKKITSLTCALLAMTSVPALSGTFGPLANFDVINDTGKNAHGFEIEIDDLHKNEITSIFGVAPRWTGMNRYPDPVIEEFSKPSASKGYATKITWTSPFNGSWAAGTPSGTLPVSPHDSCWPLGAAGQFGPNYPCDHYGISTTISTPVVAYRWLLENSPNSPNLTATDVPVPNPVWTVVPQPPIVIPNPVPQLPPIVQPQPPIVNVVIAAPKPNYYEFGEPRWVKVTATGTLQNIGIENLMAEDALFKKAQTQVQLEWQLLQTDTGNPAAGQIDLTGVALDPGATGVVYRFEFYKYTGTRDLQTNEAKVGPNGDTPGLNGPSPGDLGEFIIAQNAGINFDGVIPPAPPMAIAPTLNATIAGAVVNAPYSQVINATPGNVGDPLTFAVSGLPAGLALSKDTIAGIPTVVGNFPLNITVTDALVNLSTSGTTNLNVADAPIVFPLTLSQGTEGAAYSEILAATGGYGGLTYTVFNNSLPPGLTLSGNIIAGTPSAAGTYNVQLIVKDSLGFSTNATQNVTIVKAPVVVPPPPPPVPVACADTNQIITAVNATSLDIKGGIANGGQSVIFPVGQNAAQYKVGDIASFTGVLDANNYCVANTLTTIPGLSLPSISLVNADIGKLYTSAVIAPIGGISPSIYVSGLPFGFSFANGMIQGTAVSGYEGTYQLTVTTNDILNEQVITTVSFTINAPPAVPCSGTNQVVNQFNKFWLDINGGAKIGGQSVYYAPQNATTIVPPLTAAAIRTVGNIVSYSGFMDGAGIFCVASSMSFSQGLSFIAPVLTNASVGVFYTSIAIAPIGGVAPYGVSVTGFPASLSFNGSAIVGTPKLGDQGTYTLTINVSDATGRSLPANTAILVIDAAPAIILGASSISASGQVGTAFAGSVTATGGFGALSWTGKGLPNGVTLSSTGILSGTPSLAGTYNLVLTVTDSLGQTAPVTATVTIATQPTPPVTSCTIPKGAKTAHAKAKITAVGINYVQVGTVKVDYATCSQVQINGGAKAPKVGDVAEYEGYVETNGNVFAKYLTIN